MFFYIVLTHCSYLFRKEWVSFVCANSAITLPSCSEVFALFPETFWLWSWLPDVSCPKMSMSMSVSMSTKAKCHGLNCTSESGSRFPEALLTSSPPLGIPTPHLLPSFQVWRKHTASFTFLQHSDKDTKHQLQTGDTGWVGTMTNETVSISSKRSSCHSVLGYVARSSHL